MKKTASVDRISNLPDALLSIILSLLPTKQAFSTSVLSKRWARLCYSLSILEFDDETIRDDNDDAINSFCRFVDKIMLSPCARNQPSKIFGLKCRPDANLKKSLHAWVEAAKRRHVEEFNLTAQYAKLNPIIFTSQTLVVLKLKGLLVKTHFYADLPSLKTLVLKHVRFVNQNDFIKLLNACPILQDLRSSYPKFPIHIKINEEDEFKSLFLSKLVRADCSLDDVPFNAICNVEFLRITINIDPASFKGIPIFQNLIHIQLTFFGLLRGWFHVVELLQHCPKLQILYMTKEWSSSLYNKESECRISVLECSHLRSCTIINFEGTGNDLRFATYILQNASLLEVMRIDVTASSPNGLMQRHQIMEKLSTWPRISPGCKVLYEIIE